MHYFVEAPAKYPGCVGSRALRDGACLDPFDLLLRRWSRPLALGRQSFDELTTAVESDMHAQIAANLRGAGLIGKMIDEYGLDLVQEYMLHVRRPATSPLTI